MLELTVVVDFANAEERGGKDEATSLAEGSEVLAAFLIGGVARVLHANTAGKHHEEPLEAGEEAGAVVVVLDFRLIVEVVESGWHLILGAALLERHLIVGVLLSDDIFNGSGELLFIRG